MKKFNVTDLQLGDVTVMTEDMVRGYAFQIVVDRANAVDDDLGREFGEIVNQGFDKFTFAQAVEILTDWEYKVEEIA